MMNTVRLALVGAAIAALAGCTSGALSNIPTVTGGLNGAPSKSSEKQCENVAPAAGTWTGTKEQGDYLGKTLPGSFNTFTTEDAVTKRITQFQTDAAKGGADAETWSKFQCIYAPAVAVWKTKTGASTDTMATATK